MSVQGWYNEDSMLSDRMEIAAVRDRAAGVNSATTTLLADALLPLPLRFTFWIASTVTLYHGIKCVFAVVRSLCVFTAYPPFSYSGGTSHTAGGRTTTLVSNNCSHHYVRSARRAHETRLTAQPS